jgi:hypothetical protein
VGGFAKTWSSLGSKAGLEENVSSMRKNPVFHSHSSVGAEQRIRPKLNQFLTHLSLFETGGIL